LLREAVRIFAGIELIREWWETTKADVQNNAKRPDIDSTGVLAVAGIFENLRCDI
jgi:hypothetical protein